MNPVSARHAKSARNRVTLDIIGTPAHVERRLVAGLRDLAARAGASSQHRDLSLVLDHSLKAPTLTLRRAELRTLLDVAAQSPPCFAHLSAELERATSASKT
jgi:hypothetical protein